MSETSPHPTRIRLHLTNVAGAGATQLLESLLPAIELNANVIVERIDLPNRGKLATYCSCNSVTITNVYQRYLPNALSRILECTFLAGRFDGDSPLLVLGDLPLRCRGPQTLFVQTPNLIKPKKTQLNIESIKYWISRSIFRLNMGRVKSFIVQTETMRNALERSFPGVVGKVHIIPQPVPGWLLNSGLRRIGRVKNNGQALDLIYPAAGYSHKNHSLLSRLDSRASWPVERLTLTLDERDNPAPNLSWVKCMSFLHPQAMIDAYAEADGLLFLSKQESYGFPLIEAMFIGLPIICPNLPYARGLCGDEAIYFDPDEPKGLHQALTLLKSKLDQGWWPDWKDRLSNIPPDWESVAGNMIEVVCKTH